VLLAFSAAPAAAHRIDTAVAPSASRFMWQNLQEKFRTKAGKACRANVSMGAETGAICYVSPAHRLRCAGEIFGGRNYGSTFRLTGQTNVKQLLMGAGATWVCSLSRQGRLACMGLNVGGALARDELSSTTFLPWGDPDRRYTNVATSEAQVLCARRTDGQIFCAGEFYMPDGTRVTTGTPVLVGSGSTVWVDRGSGVKIDDPAVFRAQDGFTTSVVTTLGLDTGGVTYGTPGKVVAGNATDSRACWLESDGAVACRAQPNNVNPNPPLVPAFTQGKAIFVSRGFLGDPLCAVFNDGSLWCRGTTPMGSFAAETQVAPPGSLPRTCRP
jgi:ribosomal protein L27